MMDRKLLNRVIWGITIVSIAWAIVLAADWIPQLRGDYGWRWPYDTPEVPRLFPLALCLGVYLSVGIYLLQRQYLVMWALLGSAILSVASLTVTIDNPHYALYTRTLSGLTTGWHRAATLIDEQGGADTVFSEWPDTMRQEESAHVAISPPGMVMGYYAVNQVLERFDSITDQLGPPLRAEQCHEFRFFNYSNAEFTSTWLGVLTPLWAAFTVMPLFWLGRRLYSEQAARWSVLWWPLIPAFLMFTPYPSTLYPLLGLLAFALLVEGIHRQQQRWVLAAGLVMSLLTFMNFSVLPLIFLAGVFTLGVYVIRRDAVGLEWPFTVGAWFGVGLASVWIVYYVLFGVGIWQMFDASMEHHLALERDYLPWLFLHVYDFVIFTGLPLILLAIWRLTLLRHQKAWSMGDVLGLSALVTVLVLDISGIARGETGRVWLFLTPFFVLMAADTLKHTPSPRIGQIITLSQAFVLFIMIGFLRVIGTELTESPDAPPDILPTAEVAPISNGSVFGNTYQLNQFAGNVVIDEETGQLVLHLWLEWASTGQLDRPYELTFIPVAPDGSVAPVAASLFNKAYPTTCWLPKSGPIRDYYTIPLHSTVAGEWWVSVAMIDRFGNTLIVQMPDGTTDQQVGIGPFYEIPVPSSSFSDGT